MTVVGLQDSSFTAKDGSGKVIHGYRFHVQAPISEGGVGFRCDSFWCSKEVGDTVVSNFPDLDSVLGADIQPLYFKGGRSPTAIILQSHPAAAKK